MYDSVCVSGRQCTCIHSYHNEINYLHGKEKEKQCASRPNACPYVNCKCFHWLIEWISVLVCMISIDSDSGAEPKKKKNTKKERGTHSIRRCSRLIFNIHHNCTCSIAAQISNTFCSLTSASGQIGLHFLLLFIRFKVFISFKLITITHTFYMRIPTMCHRHTTITIILMSPDPIVWFIWSHIVQCHTLIMFSSVVSVFEVSFVIAFFFSIPQPE